MASRSCPAQSGTGHGAGRDTTAHHTACGQQSRWQQIRLRPRTHQQTSMKQHTGTYPIHLFDEHFVQKWVEPLLKTTVVVVRHDQVADAVVAFHAQVLPSAHVPESCQSARSTPSVAAGLSQVAGAQSPRAPQRKVTNVVRHHALHEVLLDASRCSAQHVNLHHGRTDRCTERAAAGGRSDQAAAPFCARPGIGSLHARRMRSC